MSSFSWNQTLFFFLLKYNAIPKFCLTQCGFVPSILGTC